MLAGVKIIPREEIDQDQVEGRKKSGSNRVKKGGKQKNYKYSSSDDDLDIVKKRSGKKKKKWYSSDEYSSSNSSNSEDKRSKKRPRSRKKHNSSEGNSSTDSGSDTISAKKNRHRKRSNKNQQARSKEDIDDANRKSQLNAERKSMGLEWMLRPDNDGKKSAIIDDQTTEEPQIEEVKKVNPRELNPYYKENGSGFPDEEDDIEKGVNKLIPSSVVGDGGASWRLKALKRAQEQAAREGRKLEEVAGERWGSLGELAVSVSSGRAAPFRAHLHAINHRKRGQTDDDKIDPENQNERVKEKGVGRDYLKNVSVRHPDMKSPKAHALSWGKRRDQSTHKKDSELVSAVVSRLNKFENDGNFLRGSNTEQKSIPDTSQTSSAQQDNYVDSKLDSSDNKQSEVKATVELLSANQLTAKVMKLRMKGKHQEADELLKEAENIKANRIVESDSIRPRNDGGKSSILMPNMLVQRKGDDDDADIHLAQKIVQNKKFSISGRADEEYDYDEGPRRKTPKKGGNSENRNLVEKNSIANRIMTQQERCQFCFENSKRPKHLTVSIANFTYLMLPQWQPVVPGHCCILPLQHELATRTVDNNVWDEIRNFKKCLIMMFAKQEKDVVFLETVMELTKQQRHCMIECIPLPQTIAKQAPLYFKKAIDEAEDEWSQHNAKRLIDTTEKGLRGSVPKGFPYFHVEFGLNKGFVHVIEDEQKFKSGFGLNVIRGMLKLPEEDMYRRRRHESVDAQNKAVTSLALEWAPFDWTKQL